MHPTVSRLEEFVAGQEDDIQRSKGKLSLLLAVTERAKGQAPPYDDADFLTPRKGQVAGAGGGVVRGILRRHGIDRVLSSEGGRTSRGSVHLMRAYLAVLNDLHQRGTLDLTEAETFWVGAVRDFFAAAPLRIRLDPAWSVERIVSEVMVRAYARQSELSGTMVAGAVLQHLVGAKLRTALPAIPIGCSGFSVADEQTGREGDFLIGETAIHVTTAPSEHLLVKCQRNINSGLHVLIVTTRDGAGGAEAHARNLGIHERVSVLTVEQFVATNVFELSGFTRAGRQDTLKQIIDAYNSIVEEVESDPSLRIEVGN